MAKKKNSMALFEVVAKEGNAGRDAEMGVPPWMQKRPKEIDTPGIQTEDAAETTPASAQDASPDKTYQAEPVRAAPADSPSYVSAEPSGHEPIVSTAGGRLTLSLNYMSCTVALLAIVLALIMAFALGRSSAPDGPQSAEWSPPVPAQGDSQAQQASVVPDVAERTPARVSGKYYLVIQALGGLNETFRDEAQHIAQYCTEVGYTASVMRDDTQYLVWSLEPFDSPDGKDARQYQAEIDGVGKRYKTLYSKKWDFAQLDPEGRLRRAAFRVQP